MGEPEIPDFNGQTLHLRTSAHTGFVDTAKLPIARTFFFIYLKQMLSEK